MKKGKYLLVKGTCGLGNRLITLANALEYCEKTGRKIIVDWCDGMFASKGYNAFNEFFEIKNFLWQKEVKIPKDQICSFYPDVARNLPDNFSIDEYFYTCSANKKGSKLLDKLIHFGSGVAHTLLSEDYFKYYFVLWARWELKQEYSELRSGKFQGNFFCLGGDMPVSRKEDVILFGDFCPHIEEKYVRNNIVLKKGIRDEISCFCNDNQLREKTVGVHIRCTDKRFDEDLKDLFAKIDSFIQKHSLEKIFLATDQAEVKDKMLAKYKEKIIIYDKYIPNLEDEKLGIHTWALEQGDNEIKHKILHDAIMEMYLLAETEYLLYQGNSTFSYISYCLKNDDRCFDWQKML